MTTYDRETYLRARGAWDEGEFGPKWDDVKRISWDRGFAYPPAGTKFDSREDENPSQRAIIYAALIDRPLGTRGIVSTSRSWSEVVGRVIGIETELREDLTTAEREAELARVARPSRREAVLSIAEILSRLPR